LVTNTADSGLGSLRQAILNANASVNAGTPDIIRFAIPGVGAHTIQLLSQLPDITDPVVIDGTTQPGYSGTPVIELDGSLAGNADGLEISSGDTTVRGLDIHSFVGDPNGLIDIVGPSGGNVIQGNYLGTNLAGNAIYPLANQGSYGVIIFGSSNNVIGTDGDGVNDAAEGNVISGNNTAGVLIENGQPGQTADSNVIAGNLIGTNSDGISDAAERNLISGNTEAGISLIGGTSTLIAGNLIGTNLAGTAALPNGAGVDVQNSNNNLIGNTSAGAGNVIADNNSNGVWISGGTGNTVSSNSIYNNGRLGIDLSSATDPANGVTPNDAGDADTGSNNLQNYPQITTALASSTQTTLGGSLQSTPKTTFRVELFASTTADPSGYGEGQTYLGSTSVTTDATGLTNFVVSLASAVPVGQFISATATDPAGNTSEFSLSVPVAASSSQPNVAMLRVPGTNAPFLISSPAGTTITASDSSSAGATPPGGLTFPFGFVTFQVSGVAAGAAVDVTLTGLDPSQIAQYYKYGPTPVTHANHWYDFLYNKATDGDSAVGTGMQIVGGNIVLHLIDGKRGDDDLTANGVVTDIGGPVQNMPPKAANDSASTLKNAPVTISVLANDSDSDGTLNAASVTLVAGPTHGTTSINPTTGAVTYTPAANYTGSDSFTYKVQDNNGAFSNIATVSLTVIPTGSISGTEYLDVTGNGATADDTPLSGVTVFLDTNNNGILNSGEPTTTTLADGSYSFANLPAGNYVVRQVTPTGDIRTAPATSDNYSLSLTAGQNSTGNNFDNAALGNPAALTNIVYVINGVTALGDLRGVTHEGDTVQVTFTVVPGTPAQQFTLVSYTAPSNTYDATKAAQQKIFQTATGVFGPGTYTLSVSNPHSYFQVDFVSGAAIDHFGASTSNIFYSNQNRLFSADNGGTHAVLSSPATLTGTVYRDTNNNGIVDAGELPIAGATVTATAGSTTQTVVTDIHGVYHFDNLPAGTYTVTETQPIGYTDGKDTLGNKGGTAANDKFTGIVLAGGTAATGYNFGEQQTVGAAVAGNQTQTIAWWNGSSGQALIKAVSGGANSKALGTWLATNYNNLFGANAGSANNLSGKTNTQVAAYYQSLYANSAKRAETEALALALAVYVTNSGLAGTTATTYGFAVSATGLGVATFGVGANGSAFGVDNATVLTVNEILARANARTQKGVIWDSNGDGSLSTAESALRGQVASLFDSINNL
jgi:parallel beta-helix repeat protein